MNDVSQHFDLDAQRREGLTAATAALSRGELVVVPTDTVYGLACNAFAPEAVQRLLDAKGRGRQMPPPVLVAGTATLEALATGVSPWARALAEAFWPGPLTLVFRQQASLRWDLGESKGTVAIRIPAHEDLLDLLSRTGPLAVSSANTTGDAAAQNVADAQAMLGDSVAIYLDGGPTSSAVASTIVDCTSASPRLLREGQLSVAALDEVLAPFGLEVVAS